MGDYGVLRRYGAPLWGFYGAPLWGCYGFYGALLWGAAMGRRSGAAMGRCCGALLWGAAVGRCHGALVRCGAEAERLLPAEVRGAEPPPTHRNSP